MSQTTGSAAPVDLAGYLAGYTPLKGVADELKRPDGSIRPVWEPLMRLLATQTPEMMAQRFARGDQYLRDTGVYFREYTTSGSAERDWPLSHVPVVIAADEWATLAEGIVQRAEVLEHVMADLYGPGELVRQGFLPAELVAQNPEWLRPVVGLTPRSGHFLHFLAFEVGRSPDGSWLVLGDRTQAPSGAGFAVENRLGTARVFNDHYPQANVERLAAFFAAFRDALHGLRGNTGGRVGILTPGQHTDTYFEHAYIARYLAVMLLEGEDLRVTDGVLTVRTINGPEPVDVLWRRLDSRFADPLQLDESSALGTPGMVSATRSGEVAMVNALGSGALEARAMMAFLPRIAETLLGKPLKLPNIATWWCGQPSERKYVVDNLTRMLIGPALSTKLPFDVDASTALGGKFRGTAHEPIADWIDREGDGLVGQEAVTLSTTPAMIDGTLLPRPMLIRVFATRTPNGWTVMPGGYARIGRTEDPTALAMQAGGSVADVWVTSDAAPPQENLNAQSEGPFVRRLPGMLPSRAADNLFWLGRYVERAESAVRLLRAYNQRLEAFGEGTLPLTQTIKVHLAKFGLDPKAPVPQGLLDLFNLAWNAAAKIRDRFSPDGLNALADLDKTARQMKGQVQHGDDAIRAMTVLLRKLAGYSGLVHENMFRQNGWRFLTIGRSLERADQMAILLSAFADLRHPRGGFDVAVEVADSVMAHRRRYSVETNRNTVIDLLALDEENPRSILFQLERIKLEEEKIANSTRRGPAQRSEAGRQILALSTSLAVAAPDEVTTDRLLDIRGELAAISVALADRYLG